ncbi:3'(2'),5'-bisphosphate nucleotidase CysQ [Rhizobium sp. KVB221]|uniref:3'(2'),5'-bisphosphate nucleotidase CysQ n=1 Tax=Rhizobium setariae TaxID=2801340 RepID=A0A937CKL6_9HYPH|nr:3'(2'),5'-bisphosphate nucleotidase CysQ [Rhizobium setariae]MBL0370596.1 3'(2'),5'-bisphosphate nucleotidase CysQ [Rhizobium setariae]
MTSGLSTPSRPQYADDLDLLVEAAKAAGREAMTYFRNDVKIWWKNEGTSPVTAADHAANDVLKHRLLSARPDYGWLSEESEDSAERLSRHAVFIVDPIDGTRAFMAGKDTWVVSAAVTMGGLPVAGVLYAPALDELYVATADGLVEKNGEPLALAGHKPGEPIRISAADDMVKALRAPVNAQLERMSRIPSLAYRLAMIADGRLDATLVKPNAHDWDLAAADLILRNAGGRLTNLAGEALLYNTPIPRHNVLVAADAGLHRAILAAFPGGTH